MNIKPIRNDEDLKVAFQRLELVFQAPDGSPEADEMEVLVTLIEAYERKHYPICPADPIDAIQYEADEGSLTKAQVKQLKKSAPKAKGGTVCSSLFGQQSA